MKILFWIPPWMPCGDPLFFKNTLIKHLAPQANILSISGQDIEMVLPEFLYSERDKLDKKIKLIRFGMAELVRLIGRIGDPSIAIYKDAQNKIVNRISERLSKNLSKTYDAIFLWESPVPFLEILYPKALIIHQMPGAFSRSPYPDTTIFDPIGLYKYGSLYNYYNEILNGIVKESDKRTILDYIDISKNCFDYLKPFKREDINNNCHSVAILPLQTSSHYAFRVDTKYENQTEYLFDILSSINENTSVVVTQYASSLISDRVITENLFVKIKKKWKNFYWCKEFDAIPGISQYLLPETDSVITCSSSIGIQAMLYNKKLIVPCNTFLKPFESSDNETFSSWNIKCTNTLGYILTKNQPLVQMVRHNSKFLLNLLEQLIYLKHTNSLNPRSLPSFSDIDCHYNDYLLNSFTQEKSEKDLKKYFSVDNQTITDIAKFRKNILNASIKYITFDVFDTLITRVTETPADIYKFLEKEAVALSNGILEDFAKYRLLAETEVRKIKNGVEIFIDDIYRHLANYYDVQLVILEAVKNKEIELELSMIRPRSWGKKLWNEALKSNKKIYLISDMYLPKCIIELMLHNCGYEKNYEKLFVSNEYGVRKKEGKLFDIVLKEINANGSEILHIGDNKEADIDRPQEYGIKTFRIVRALDKMRKHIRYSSNFPGNFGIGERGRSAVAGLIAKKLFDLPLEVNDANSHFNGKAHNLGYAGLGPLVLSYVVWISNQAKRDGISKIYFFSREGLILKKIYDIIFAQKDKIPSEYLYASRRVIRVASLTTKGDVLALATQPFRAGITVRNLLKNRFGYFVSDDDLKYNLEISFDYILSSEITDKVKFIRICAKLSQNIIKASKNLAITYKSYLKSTGIIEEKNPAIVDIGWRANMQGMIGKLISKSLTGYYYATLQGAELWLAQGHKVWSFSGNFISVNYSNVLLQNRHLIEYLLCCTDPTLIDMEKQDASYIPIFQSEDKHSLRFMFINDVHCGIEHFARDFLYSFGNKSDCIYLNTTIAENVISSFIQNPSKHDAELLVGHYFEDSLGGIEKQYIISPTYDNYEKISVWKQGAQAVYNTSNNTSKNAKNKFNKYYSFLLKSEKFIVKLFISSHKYNKYLSNRDLFFIDSKNFFAKKWFNFLK
ncbi:MAG: hypothetical protein LBD84_03850 [Campylobacteraceae bacterium]|jgi:predicted HAD superfamily hydrolase|nr:hypothetical protein [Campylobacteraceae bacterium]